MDSQRNLLIIALLFVSFIIWQVWEQDKNTQSQKIESKTEVLRNSISTNQCGHRKKGKQIVVKTDVLKLIINTCGGNIEQAFLLSYQNNLKSKEPLQLLKTTSEFIYQAQSGIIGFDSLDNLNNNLCPLYYVNEDEFFLDQDQNKLIIPMTWNDTNGNTFTKIFTLRRGEYTVDVDYNIKNTGTDSLVVSTFGQLKQSVKLPIYDDTNENFSSHTFRGAAYSTLDKKYKKYKFNTIINNENLNIYSKGGWIAMLQQYFATAWIPRNNDINNFYTININNDIAVIGYKSQPIVIKKGEIGKLKSTLWIGPEIQDKMATVAPYLDLTVDYGFLWFISQPLFKLLKFIYSYLGNWGFSIIVITFIVRGIMYPLTKAQYNAMAKLRMLQPKIQDIRRLYNDRQRQSQEIIALYKSEKVNPLGGCFPLLIQMPIFLALYYMLISAVELRHAPFVFWIVDLSAQDPYYILPILMGITMLLIQKISPTTIDDPIQKKVIIFMPIIFTMFFLFFPSGLVLYYIVSNLVTIIQQLLIYRTLKKVHAT